MLLRRDVQQHPAAPLQRTAELFPGRQLRDAYVPGDLQKGPLFLEPSDEQIPVVRGQSFGQDIDQPNRMVCGWVR